MANNNEEIAYKLVDLINCSDHTPDSYSGRGMSGEECLSVNPESPSIEGFFADLLDIAIDGDELAVVQDDIATIVSAMRMAQTDTLGLGIVIYWPRLPFVQD